jgi:hypothetical protein
MNNTYRVVLININMTENPSLYRFSRGIALTPKKNTVCVYREIHEIMVLVRQSCFYLHVLFHEPYQCRKYPATGITRYTTRENEGVTNEMTEAMNAMTGISNDR